MWSLWEIVIDFILSTIIHRIHWLISKNNQQKKNSNCSDCTYNNGAFLLRSEMCSHLTTHLCIHVLKGGTHAVPSICCNHHEHIWNMKLCWWGETLANLTAVDQGITHLTISLSSSWLALMLGPLLITIICRSVFSSAQCWARALIYCQLFYCGC